MNKITSFIVNKNRKEDEGILCVMYRNIPFYSDKRQRRKR